jgi:hypothetical protein
MHDRRDEQLDRLFKAVRDEPVDTSALEEHFETRLLARISELRTPSLPWYAMAWRMVPAFALVAAAITICAYIYTPPAPHDLFAAISDDQEEVAGTSILTGE